MPPLHSHSHLKNTRILWSSTDTQELYNKNLKSVEKLHLLNFFDWVDKEIVYQYNSHGFRTPEFDSRENFITLGCSFTEGTGLNVEQTWHYYLEQLTGMQGWNLGVSGSGLDTCYRLARFYIPLLKPKFVILLEPFYNRFELHCNRQPPWIINTSNSDCWQDNVYIKNWVADSTNMQIAAEKNVYAIDYWCQKLNIELHHYNSDLLLTPTPPGSYDLARDLQHPGQKTNERFANYVYNDIKGRYE